MKEETIFAGGCFWCMEPVFEELEGVIDAQVGYTGGTTQNPRYHNMGDHYEAVRIQFDSTKISYEKIIDVFWRNIDPTDSDGQFVDKGTQYRTAIFYLNDTQKETALKSKEALEKSGRFSGKIVTQILPATEFTFAEEYHQDYYKKQILGYLKYKDGSGRDEFKTSHWEKK